MIKELANHLIICLAFSILIVLFTTDLIKESRLNESEASDNGESMMVSIENKNRFFIIFHL